MELMPSPLFWVGLLKIVWINVILSGDNAVVIALSARSLPRQQQLKAVVLGSGAAVLLRMVLTVVAARLMPLPFFPIAGGLLLLWIGVQMFAGEAAAGPRQDAAAGGLAAAIRTLLLADLVMSLDNVVALAAAAQGDLVLLVIGLALSIPLVVFGSTLTLALMERFPLGVVPGAVLIGWVGGEAIVQDASLHEMLAANPGLHYAAAVACAMLVMLAGRHFQARTRESSTN